MPLFNKNTYQVIVTGPDKPYPVGWWATRFSLELCGLRAKYWTANTILEEVLDFQGIIISGGDDIEPSHYGFTGDAGATYDKARDEFELHMAKHALRSGIPILGICRGAQLINVALGGSLYQDIRPMRRLTPNRNSIFPMKKAIIQPTSFLYQATQKPDILINSLHNQAIDRVGNHLSVCAHDKDNFIQAIEAREDAQQYIVGVQWHPEYLPYVSVQRRIFQSFANAVRHTHRHMSSDRSGEFC